MGRGGKTQIQVTLQAKASARPGVVQNNEILMFLEHNPYLNLMFPKGYWKGAKYQWYGPERRGGEEVGWDADGIGEEGKDEHSLALVFFLVV